MSQIWIRIEQVGEFVIGQLQADIDFYERAIEYAKNPRRAGFHDVHRLDAIGAFNPRCYDCAVPHAPRLKPVAQAKINLIRDVMPWNTDYVLLLVSLMAMDYADRPGFEELFNVD